MKPEPMDESQIEGIARDAITDALSFIESEVADDRIKAQKYYNGEVDIGEEEGRSKVVATKVRDTIRQIKPSLMRIFLSNENFVEYSPSRPDQVMQAETATKYIHSQFSENNGFRVLSNAFHDALLKKVGVAKCYWDEYEESETYELTNLTDEELAIIASDDNVDIVEQETEIRIDIDEMGMEMQTPVHEVKLMKRNQRGKLCIESIAPEEFFVNREAVSIDDCFVCGHRTEMRVGELVEMGYDFEEVSALSGLSYNDTMTEAEQFERRGYDTMDENENVLDPSMKLVALTEAYMKVDVDGTGIPQLHKLVLGGSEMKLLECEPCSRIPFAVFETDPEPHTFYGNSIADLIVNDQDAATAMLRGVLDNIAMTNSPRLAMVEGQVNIDDLLNNEIGGIVRMRTPGAVQDLSVPFIAGNTLAALEYYDQSIEQKTGVARVSTGLDPDALQNTTATAVQMTMSAGQQQIEVIARNLAEGGMKRLFQIMLEEVIENSPEDEMMRVSGDQFVPIDPRSWDAKMSITVNVGLGTGKEEQKAAALQMTLQTQMGILQTYGFQNGLVGLTNVRNTLADILALGGMRNADRYYAPMNPQIEQQLIAMQQQMAAQNQPQDPNAALAQAQVQAEMIRAQAKQQEVQAKIQLEAQKALAEDDRERDKMDAELLTKAADILGRWGVAVDVEQIKQMQAAPRYADTAPQEAVQGARY